MAEYIILTLKIDISAEIEVEDINDAFHEWIFLELWNGHELLHRQRAAVVEVELLEALLEPGDLLLGEALHLRHGADLSHGDDDEALPQLKVSECGTQLNR